MQLPTWTAAVGDKRCRHFECYIDLHSTRMREKKSAGAHPCGGAGVELLRSGLRERALRVGGGHDVHDGVLHAGVPSPVHGLGRHLRERLRAFAWSRVRVVFSGILRRSSHPPPYRVAFPHLSLAPVCETLSDGKNSAPRYLAFFYRPRTLNCFGGQGAPRGRLIF